MVAPELGKLSTMGIAVGTPRGRGFGSDIRINFDNALEICALNLLVLRNPENIGMIVGK